VSCGFAFCSRKPANAAAFCSNEALTTAFTDVATIPEFFDYPLVFPSLEGIEIQSILFAGWVDSPGDDGTTVSNGISTQLLS